MLINKRVILLLPLLVFILLTGACGNNPAQQQAASGNSFPMTVTDDLGNQITIPAKPSKIVSLALASDEILSAVVGKTAIAGVSEFAANPFYSNIADFAATVPNKFSGKDLEKIIKLKPDLVITANWTDARDLARLREAGIAVFAYKLPDTIDDIRRLITQTGLITGNPEKAKNVLDTMNKQLSEISEACDKAAGANPPGVLLADNLFYVYGDKSLSGQLLQVTHLKNLASTIGVSNVENVGKEKIVAVNPQIIFLAAYSAEDGKNPLAAYLDDRSFSTVAAVKNKAVYLIPAPHLTAASQYIVLGAEDIAKAAWPQLVIK